MRKLFLILSLLVAWPAFGQYGNTVTTHGVGAPGGTCVSAVQRYVNDSNGNTYSCYGTTWVLSGSTTAIAHNFLSATHGDVHASAVVRGDIIVGRGTTPTLWERLAKGNQYLPLTMGADEPGWTALALDQTTATSGLLPSSRGGTGNGFFKVSGPTTAEKTFTLPDADATGVTGAGTTNTLPKYTTGASGIVGDSLLTDDGTTATYAGTGGVSAPAFTATGPGVPNITPAALGAAIPGNFGILAGSPDLFWFYDDTAFRYSVATTDGKMRSFASFEGVCQDTTASFSFDTEATNDPAPACITGTNTKNRAVLDFDAAADEEVFGSVWLPPDWTGAIDVDVEALANEASTASARLGIQTICVGTSEVYDPAFNAASTWAWTGDGTANHRIISTKTGITATGCAANERMFFRFYRDADGTSGTDDLAVDLRVVALRFKTRWTP